MSTNKKPKTLNQQAIQTILDHHVDLLTEVVYEERDSELWSAISLLADHFGVDTGEKAEREEKESTEESDRAIDDFYYYGR